jgi:hypothetical protein
MFVPKDPMTRKLLEGCFCFSDEEFEWHLKFLEQAKVEEEAQTELQKLAGKWAKLRALRMRAFFGVR